MNNNSDGTSRLRSNQQSIKSAQHTEIAGIRAAVLAAGLLAALSSGGQTTLPTYTVVSSGASSAQAATLAGALRIAAGAYSTDNGVISFIDPTNYLRIPTTPVTDATALSNLVAGTLNRNPSIPLKVEAIDWATLTNMVALGSNSAVTLTASVLSAAGLTPQFGSPVASHTMMSWNYTNESQVLVSNSQRLDAEVAYQFTEPGGIPLVGPGARVQVAYQPGSSNCTHLLYAARQLAIGPSVAVFSPGEASNRVAHLYASLNPQISAQLVYYCPPLSSSGVSNIIPHYLCGGTGTVTNQDTGSVSTINLLLTMIPATGDPAFVPEPVLSVGVNSAGQVLGNVTVTGGRPPYTYAWSGSDPALWSNYNSIANYTPQQLVTPVLMVPYLNSAGQLVVSWFDPTDNLALQSTASLSSPTWEPDTHSITVSNGMKSVTADTSASGASGGTRFYRLVSQSHPTSETLRVTVTDANGISSTVNQAVIVNPQPVPDLTKPPGEGVTWFLWDWGTESPWYTGDDNLGAWDTDDWRTGMKACNGAGNENFFWKDKQSTAQDYLAWPNGVAGVRGVNTASIVFHVGHADPQTIEFDGSPDLADSAKGLATSWGRAGNGNESTLDWLGFLACNLMQEKNVNLSCEKRWGPAFNGLHLMLGFTTIAEAQSGFPRRFAKRLLGCDGNGAQPLAAAWFLAASESFVQLQWQQFNVGKAAAMSPITTVWDGQKWVQVSDIGDYFWGQGGVGIDIPPNKATGFTFMSQ